MRRGGLLAALLALGPARRPAAAWRWDTPSVAHEYLLDEEPGGGVFLDTAPLYRDRFSEPTLANATLDPAAAPAWRQPAHPKAWPGGSVATDGLHVGPLATADWSADERWSGGWTVELWVRPPRHADGLQQELSVLRSNASSFSLTRLRVSNVSSRVVFSVGELTPGECELAVSDGLPTFRQHGAWNASDPDAAAWRTLRASPQPPLQYATELPTPAPTEMANGSRITLRLSNGTWGNFTETLTPLPRPTLTGTPTGVWRTPTETLAANASATPTLIPGAWAHLVWVYDDQLRVVEYYVNGSYAGDTPRIDDSAVPCDFRSARVALFGAREPTEIPWRFDNLRFYAEPLTERNITNLYNTFYQPPSGPRFVSTSGVKQVGEPLTVRFRDLAPFASTVDAPTSLRVVRTDCDATNATDPEAEVGSAEWLALGDSVELTPFAAADSGSICLSYDGRQTWHPVAVGVTLFDVAAATGYTLAHPTIPGVALDPGAVTVGDEVVFRVTGTGLSTFPGWDLLMLVRIPVEHPPAVALPEALQRESYAQVCARGGAGAFSVGPATDLGPGDADAQTAAEAPLRLSASGDFFVCYRAAGGTNGGTGAPWALLWEPLGAKAPLVHVATGKADTEWTTLLGVEAGFAARAAAGDPHFSAGLGHLLGPNLTYRSVRAAAAPAAWAPPTTLLLRFERVEPQHGAWLVGELRRLLATVNGEVGKAVNFTCPYCATACPESEAPTAPAPPPTVPPTFAPLAPGASRTPAPTLPVFVTGQPTASPIATVYCNLTSVVYPNTTLQFYPGSPTDMGFEVGGVWAGEQFTITIRRQVATTQPPPGKDRIRLVWGEAPPFSSEPRCVSGVPFDIFSGGVGTSVQRSFTITLTVGHAAPGAVCYSQPGDTTEWREVATVLDQELVVGQAQSFLLSPYPPFRGQPFSVMVAGLALQPTAVANDTLVVTNLACPFVPPVPPDQLITWWDTTRKQPLYFGYHLWIPLEVEAQPYADAELKLEGRQGTFSIRERTFGEGDLRVCYFPGAGRGIERSVHVPETYFRMMVTEKPGFAIFSPFGTISREAAGSGWQEPLAVVLGNTTDWHPVPNPGAVCRLRLEMVDMWWVPPIDVSTGLVGKSELTTTWERGELCNFTGVVGAPRWLFGWAILWVTVTLTDGSDLSASVRLFIRHPCSGAGTCSRHGVCNTNGTCDCATSMMQGHWETSDIISALPTTQCDTCQWGFYGPECDVHCDPARTCQGRGQCSAEGACACDYPFQGPQCQHCRQPELRAPCNPQNCRADWYGETCDIYCDPVRTCHGHGFCSGELRRNPAAVRQAPCQCEGRWAGGHCEVCHVGYTGPACQQALPDMVSGPHCASPAPFEAVSAVLSRSRRRLAITFSQTVNVSSSPGSFPCGLALRPQDVLLLAPPNATGAVGWWLGGCSWSDGRTLEAAVSEGSPVSLASRFELRSVWAVRRADGCPLARTTVPGLQGEAGGLPALRAALVAPATVASCETLTLIAGAEPLRSGPLRAEWGLLRGAGVLYLQTVADHLAATNDTTLSLGPGLLAPGTYRFRVALTDPWGQVGSAEATVLRRSVSEDSGEGLYPGSSLGLPGRELRVLASDAALIPVRLSLPPCLFGAEYGRAGGADGQRFSFEWSMIDGLRRPVDLLPLRQLGLQPLSVLQIPAGVLSPLYSPYSVTLAVRSQASIRAAESQTAVIRVPPAPLRLRILGGGVALPQNRSAAPLSAACHDPELDWGRANLPPARQRLLWGCAGPADPPPPGAAPGASCPLLRGPLTVLGFSTAPAAPPGWYAVSVRCTNTWMSDAFPYERNATRTAWVRVVPPPGAPAARRSEVLQGADPSPAEDPDPAPPADLGNGTNATNATNATAPTDSSQPLPAPPPPAVVSVSPVGDPYPHSAPLALVPTVRAPAGRGGMLPSFGAARWRCAAGPLQGAEWAPRGAPVLQLPAGSLRPMSLYVFEAAAEVSWRNATHASAPQEHSFIAAVRTSGLVQGTVLLAGALPAVPSLGEVVATAEGWLPEAPDDGDSNDLDLHTELEFQFSAVHESGAEVVACPWGPQAQCSVPVPLALPEDGGAVLGVLLRARDAAGTVLSASAAAPVAPLPGEAGVGERLLARIGFYRELGGSGAGGLLELVQWLGSLHPDEAAAEADALAGLSADAAVQLVGSAGFTVGGGGGQGGPLGLAFELWQAAQTGLERERAARAAALAATLTTLGPHSPEPGEQTVVAVSAGLRTLVSRRVNSFLTVPLPADEDLARHAWSVAEWVAARVAGNRSAGAADATATRTLAAGQERANVSGEPSRTVTVTAAVDNATGDPSPPSTTPAPGALNPLAGEKRTTDFLATAPFLCNALANATLPGAEAEWAAPQGLHVTVRRAFVAYDLAAPDGAASEMRFVAAPLTGEESSGTADLCRVAWGRDMLWWAPAQNPQLLWGGPGAAPTVSLFVQSAGGNAPPPPAAGATVELRLPVPAVRGWAPRAARCGYWDSFERAWSTAACRTADHRPAEAAQPTPAPRNGTANATNATANDSAAGGGEGAWTVRCRCAAAAAPLHLTLLNGDYYTPAPSPQPPPAPTPEPPVAESPPDRSFIALALLGGYVVLVVVLTARQRLRDVAAERALAAQWKRDALSVRCLYSVLTQKGYAAGPLVSDSSAEVVEFLVSRRKVTSELNPTVYGALAALVDSHPWARLLWSGAARLAVPGSSLRYSNLGSAERLAVAACCSMVAPLLAAILARGDPLHFDPSDHLLTAGLLCLATFAGVRAVSGALLLLHLMVPARSGEAEEERDAQEFSQHTERDRRTRRSMADTIGLAARLSRVERRLSNEPNIEVVSEPDSEDDDADATPAGKQSEGPESSGYVFPTDGVSPTAGAQPAARRPSVTFDAPRVTMVEPPPLGRRHSSVSTRRRSSLRKSLAVADSRGHQFLLSFAELDHIFFDEVRDARLHTAVAVDLCKTLYSKGLLGMTSLHGDIGGDPISPDFFTTRTEESTRRVRALFERTFRDLSSHEAHRFMEHRLGRRAPWAKRKQKGLGGPDAFDDDASSSSSSTDDSAWDDITISDASDAAEGQQRARLRAWRATAAMEWSGQRGFKWVWHQEQKHPLWEAAEEACRMLQLRLAAALFQLALLSENPDLFCVFTCRTPPDTAAAVVEAVLGVQHSVGALFAYDFCRGDPDLRLPLDCFAAALQHSPRPSVAELLALCSLECDVPWQGWTWPGGAPYFVDEELPEARRDPSWERAEELLREGELLRAAHVLRYVDVAGAPPTAAGPVRRVWAPRTARGRTGAMRCGADGAIWRDYQPPQHQPRSIAIGRLLALFYLGQRSRARGEQAADAPRAAAEAMLAQERERLEGGAGPEHAALRGPALRVPPASALCDTRNEWLAYYLNYRVAGERGAVFCIPEDVEKRGRPTPFYTLCRLSQSKGTRRGSGTLHNPFYGAHAAIGDLREGDALLLLAGTYPPLRMVMLSPPEADADQTSAMALEVAPYRWRRRGRSADPVVVSAADTRGADCITVAHSQHVILRGLRVRGGRRSVDARLACGVRLDACEADSSGPFSLSPADCRAGAGGPAAQGGCREANPTPAPCCTIEPWKRRSAGSARAMAWAAVLFAFAVLVGVAAALVSELALTPGLHWALLTAILWSADVLVLQTLAAAAATPLLPLIAWWRAGPSAAAAVAARPKPPRPSSASAEPDRAEGRARGAEDDTDTAPTSLTEQGGAEGLPVAQPAEALPVALHGEPPSPAKSTPPGPPEHLDDAPEKPAEGGGGSPAADAAPAPPKPPPPLPPDPDPPDPGSPFLEAAMSPERTDLGKSVEDPELDHADPPAADAETPPPKPSPPLPPDPAPPDPQSPFLEPAASPDRADPE
eukprot:TRINITY_DN29500_c0_g1_i1.p1 TRINITY_DN29500_c0_g1~~TRINITY_DN29500_c0_g1_i1.p1  ORF type:complete len:3862 (+),score=937.77 TRINITY_DN29500_c0_g1_i1:75-11660(+)